MSEITPELVRAGDPLEVVFILDHPTRAFDTALTYTYDEQGRKRLETTWHWKEDQGWTEISRVETSYDEQGRPARERATSRDAEGWIDARLVQYGYDHPDGAVSRVISVPRYDDEGMPEPGVRLVGSDEALYHAGGLYSGDHQRRIDPSEQRYNRPDTDQERPESRGSEDDDIEIRPDHLIEQRYAESDQNQSQKHGDTGRERGLRKQLPYKLPPPGARYLSDADLPGTPYGASRHEIDVVEAADQQHDQADGAEYVQILRIADRSDLALVDGAVVDGGHRLGLPERLFVHTFRQGPFAHALVQSGHPGVQ